MTTQDLINTLKQGKPMTDRLMREIVRELEEKTEQVRTMSTALRAKDADYVALREAARPVAEWLKYAEITELSAPYVEEDGEKRLEVFATTEELEALAALVGEG